METELYTEMHELELSHWWFRAKREIILYLIRRELRCDGQPRFLDLGCSTGAMLAELERLGEATGMDASGQALSYASGQTNAKLVKGSVPDDLDNLDGPYDCILMLDLLEHLDKDQESIQRASHLLSRQGILVVTVPAYQWLFASRDTYHQHRRRYSRRGLRRLLEEGGYAIELLSYYNFFLFPPAAANKILSRIMKETPGPDLSLPAPLVNKTLERIFASERLLLPHLSLPFGLSLVSISRRSGS